MWRVSYRMNYSRHHRFRHFHCRKIKVVAHFLNVEWQWPLPRLLHRMTSHRYMCSDQDWPPLMHFLSKYGRK